MKMLRSMLVSYARRLGVLLPLIGQGINKITVVKKQSALGVPASGAGGQILRRETSIFTKAAATYENTEIVSHRQDMPARQGQQSVTGKLSGLLSPSTYKLFFATALRKDFAAGVNSTALTNVTAATTGGATGTFTRAAGSWLTDGFKRFDVVRWTGWAGGGATANNAHNMIITALTATVMTVQTLDGTAVVSDAAGDSVTATVAGKKTLAPLTGHTNDYLTFEEYYQDLTTQGEYFTDVKLNGITVEIPGSGNIKSGFDFMGLKRTRPGTQQLTTPAVETTTGILAAVTSGFLVVNSVLAANVSGLTIVVQEGLTADGPVIGTNFSPDIATGRIKVGGQFTAYFQDGAYQDIFDQESSVNLAIATTCDSTPASDFMGFSMTSVKVFSDTPDDGEKGVVRTYQYRAAINLSGGAALADDQTIMSVQDSAA